MALSPVDPRAEDIAALARYPFRYDLLWRLVGWSLVAGILYFSLTPSAIELDVPESDKLAHVAAYFALSAWYCQLYRRPYHGAVALAAVGLGVVIEFLQGATSYRSFELTDMLANGAGVGLAVLASTGKRAMFLSRTDGRFALWLGGGPG